MKSTPIIFLFVLFVGCMPQPIGGEYIYKNYDTAEAIIKLEQEEILYPEKWECNYYLGKSYSDQKDHLNSIKHYKLAIKKNSKKEMMIQNELNEIYKNVAEQFYSSAQYDSAAYYYRKMKKVHN